MANWIMQKNPQVLNPQGFDENDLMMGVMKSQKPGNDLIQNCDLPPPTKVYSCLADSATVIRPYKRENLQDLAYDHVEDDTDTEKLRILKALRLSQTRAREAEAKYASIIKERDALAVAFQQDSMQIFVYRQFVRLLEFQVSRLRKQNSRKRKKDDDEEEYDGDDDEDGGNNGLRWSITMAFCLGIACVGFAFGYKCLFY